MRKFWIPIPSSSSGCETARIVVILHSLCVFRVSFYVQTVEHWRDDVSRLDNDVTQKGGKNEKNPHGKFVFRSPLAYHHRHFQVGILNSTKQKQALKIRVWCIRCSFALRRASFVSFFRMILWSIMSISCRCLAAFNSTCILENTHDLLYIALSSRYRTFIHSSQSLIPPTPPSPRHVWVAIWWMHEIPSTKLTTFFLFSLTCVNCTRYFLLTWAYTKFIR